MTNTTATLILIGGKSKRINYKKQNTFIKNVTTQHIIQNTLHKIDVKNIFYSSKKKIQHPFFIQDILNNKSPLIGIYSAIYYFLKKTNFQNTLITAIDMPLLTKKILLILINTNNTYNGSYFEHTQFPLKIKITKKNLLIIKNLIKKINYYFLT